MKIAGLAIYIHYDALCTQTPMRYTFKVFKAYIFPKSDTFVIRVQSIFQWFLVHYFSKCS